MVKPSSVDSNGMRKGVWSKEEDDKLRAYIQRYGHWNWRLLPRYAGLARCGKSCRLRWMNYLKLGIKRGNYSNEETDRILELHAKLGNKWSAISAELPGRTDNDIKNYWHSHLKWKNKRNVAKTCGVKQQPSEKQPNHQIITGFVTFQSESAQDRAAAAESLSLQELKISMPPVESPHDTTNWIWFEENFWTKPFLVDNSDSNSSSFETSFSDLSNSSSSYILSPFHWAVEPDSILFMNYC